MNGSAFLLIVVGLLLVYVVLSDKFYCLEGCANCLIFGDSQTAPVGPAAASGSAGVVGSGIGAAGLGISGGLVMDQLRGSIFQH